MSVWPRLCCLLSPLLLLGCNLIPPTNPAPSDADPATIYEIAGQQFRVETVATGLEVPWSLAFPPDGQSVLVTERPGRLRQIDLATGNTLRQQTLPDVAPQLPRGEQGLMGLTLSPTFADDQTLYVSYTTTSGGGLKNVIERWQMTADGFARTTPSLVLDNIPAAFIHDGLPLRFGPDGLLYAATGEAAQADQAQNLDYLGGKILRINPDGTVPADNPFPGSPVYSLGHRNPQGFDFWPADPNLIIAVEHGPSFPLDGDGGLDELNIVNAGANYGWPTIRGDETAAGLQTPIYHSGDEAIAPAGGTIYTGLELPLWHGSFVFVGLRGASLWVAQVDPAAANPLISLDRGLQDTFGRLRAVAQGPDGLLYLTTSNRDSRGTPGPTDDRILRLIPVPADDSGIGN
jgi:glucose/arabinose dehydrogenase